MTRLLPGQKMPDIEVKLAGGGTWRLADNAPKSMLIINVYRGVHCPRCRRQLEEVNARIEEFRAAGIEVIAISADPEDRAERARAEWAMDNIPIGYGLPLQLGQQLGCYVSKTMREAEPEFFLEAGLFFVLPDLIFYAALINTVPLARPSADAMLEIGKAPIERNYPPRGTELV